MVRIIAECAQGYLMPDIEESIKVLKKHGIETIGDKSSIGAEGFKVIFIHPRSTGGVLVELAEKT